MLDMDLAELYDAPVKVLNQAVNATEADSRKTSCFN